VPSSQSYRQPASHHKKATAHQAQLCIDHASCQLECRKRGPGARTTKWRVSTQRTDTEPLHTNGFMHGGDAKASFGSAHNAVRRSGRFL
jgi:hypothetical protein